MTTGVPVTRLIERAIDEHTRGRRYAQALCAIDSYLAHGGDVDVAFFATIGVALMARGHSLEWEDAAFWAAAALRPDAPELAAIGGPQ